MTKRIFRTASAIVALVAFASSANAQQNRNCGPREAVIERLSEGYGESRQSIGLDARGGLLEVFASADSGTWTITLTAPNGVTCLIASGQSFESVAEVLPAKAENA